MSLKNKESKIYCCYSLPLRKYLYENGLEYELAALNPNSKKLFWVYLMTDELSVLLSKWSEK
jgi:hypothetical protein